MSNETFLTVEELSKKNSLNPCYQMQLSSDNTCIPIHIGYYDKVPMFVHETINRDDYNINLVTYILTEEEIKNKQFKIIGAVIFHNDDDESQASFDLVATLDNKHYQFVFEDHVNKNKMVIEEIDTFPGNENIFDLLLEKMLSTPIKDLFDGQ